jgi:hypothetical protein
MDYGLFGHFCFIPDRLGAVGAIFAASPRVDTQQRTNLYLSGIVVQPMDRMGFVDEF